MIKTLFLMGILVTLAAIAFKGPDQTAWEFARQTAAKAGNTIARLREEHSDVAAPHWTAGRSADRRGGTSNAARPERRQSMRSEVESFPPASRPTRRAAQSDTTNPHSGALVEKRAVTEKPHSAPGHANGLPMRSRTPSITVERLSPPEATATPEDAPPPAEIPVVSAPTSAAAVASPPRPAAKAVAPGGVVPKAASEPEPPIPDIPAQSRASGGPEYGRTRAGIDRQEAAIDEGTYRAVRAFYENASRLLAEIK